MQELILVLEKLVAKSSQVVGVVLLLVVAAVVHQMMSLPEMDVSVKIKILYL